jgi:hypothetical protein
MKIVLMKGSLLPGGSGRLVGFLRLSWRPAGRGRGMGHVRVACTSCHDEFRQMVFLEPPHHSGHQPLAGWVTGPGPFRDHAGLGNGDR